MSLINFEIEFDLSWSKECIISDISITSRIAGNPDANPPVLTVAAIQANGATFQTNNAELYVLVATFSINGNIKFFENIKQGFKRTISWKKYRSKVTAQTKNNNLDYMIEPTFRNINRLFVLSFKVVMMILQEIFLKSLIDNKPFFDQPVKTNKKHMINLTQCQGAMTIKHVIYYIICVIKIIHLFA